MTEHCGVLLMAYGTPATLDDVERYYTHIRGGHLPDAALVGELRDRYRAIGGSSPLLEITNAQARGLERALAVSAPGRYRVRLGMRHAPPFIEDGLAALLDDGAQSIVALVLAPHFSELSVGQYLARVRAALADRANEVELFTVEHWHLSPDYIALLAERVEAALAELRGGRCEVIFTAHSLPSRILAAGDPYPRQITETAAAVADRCDIESWSVAWQSAGRTSEPWLEPNILQALREAAQRGIEDVVVCPVGFVSDHLELLYDIDIQCVELAAELGLRLVRTPAPNDDPRFLSALAQVVLDADGAEHSDARPHAPVRARRPSRRGLLAESRKP